MVNFRVEVFWPGNEKITNGSSSSFTPLSFDWKSDREQETMVGNAKMSKSKKMCSKILNLFLITFEK